MSGEPAFRLAIATCAAMPDLHDDDRRLLAALIDAGVDARPCVWNAAEVGWSDFDAVLLRSTWDYFEHYAEFRDWLDALPVPTINPLPVLRWNSDKHYLAELGTQGIAIVPTRFCNRAQLPAALDAFERREVVVKPRVSGGAWHTVRGVVGEPALTRAVSALPLSLDLMLQPFQPEIVSAGEWSLLFFGGAFSHAVLKRPARGDYRVQAQYGGSAELSSPPDAILAAARAALAASVSATGGPPIDYARVDGVIVDGRFLLMEIELIEPYLHLGVHVPAAARLATVLRERLAQIRRPVPTP